jgi:hypothetical protein
MLERNAKKETRESTIRPDESPKDAINRLKYLAEVRVNDPVYNPYLNNPNYSSPYKKNDSPLHK